MMSIKLLTASRSAKLYLILTFISLALFFYSVGQIAYVVTERADLFGLASHFPVSYWIGLALLLLCSILVFLDRDLKSDALPLLVLLILGLYLFGIATLTQENVRTPTVYYSLADVRNLMVTGHTDITGPYPLEFYRAWPAAQFLHGAAILVTGMSLEELIDLGPLLWMGAFVLLSYAAGRGFGLSRQSSFLVGFLTISSFFAMQSDLRQPGMATLLYLSCFIVLVRPYEPRDASTRALAIICYAALLITHGSFGLVVLVAVFALAIYRIVDRQYLSLALLFAVMFGAWYLYQAWPALELGVRKLLATPWDIILRMGVRAEGLFQPAYTFASALIQLYSQVAYLAIYGISMAVAIYQLARRRIPEDRRKWVLAALVWLIGLGLAGLIFPNKENYVRLLMLALVPMAVIIVTVFSSRKVLVSLMVLCLVLLLPARYGTEGYYGEVRSSELAGVRFFTSQVEFVEPWFLYRTGDLGVLPFYNPDAIAWPKKSLPPLASPELPGILDGASYVLNSENGGVPGEVIDRWRELGGEAAADLVYNNGSFRVYKNEVTW